MSAIVTKHKIAYFSVPKIACTSINWFFFELENNRPFQPFTIDGTWISVHHFYPALSFAQWDHFAIRTFLKLAVVRDPIQRFLSGYGNQVLFHGVLNSMELNRSDRKKGLTVRPDLDQYVAHFRRYRELSDRIRHHTEPMTYSLGKQHRYFDHLFNIYQLDDLAAVVRDRVGHAPEIGHRQTGGAKFSPSDLSRRERAKIKKFYASDYRAFGKFF